MGSTFAINGKTVPRQEFNTFTDSLQEKGIETKAAAKDKNIETVEIRAFLDKDMNSKLGLKDFNGYSISAYGDLRETLRKYEFDLNQEIEDFSDGARCAQVGNCSDIPELFWEDREFLVEAFGNGTEILDEIPEEAKKLLMEDTESNREFWIEAIGANEDAFLVVPESMQSDPDFFNDAVYANGWVYTLLSEEQKRADGMNGRGLASSAVNNDGAVLEHVFPEFQSDERVVRRAVQSDASALQFADESLRDDEDFLLSLWDNDRGPDPEVFRQFPTELQSDRVFLLKTLEKDPAIYQFLPKDIREDRPFVETAVATKGTVIEYVGAAFQSDDNLIQTAAKTYGFALTMASETARLDPDYNQVIFQENAYALHHADPSIQDNADCVEAAVRRDGRLFKHASEQLRKDKDFVHDMAEIDWRVLEEVDKDLADETIVTLSQELKEAGTPLPFRVSSLADFKQDLDEKHEIAFPERIRSLTNLQLLLENRNKVGQDPRETVLLLYNSTDHNGAFQHPRVVDSYAELEDKFILYYEISTEDEVRTHIRKATQDYAQPLHTLWLAGHGSEDHLRLGAEDPENRDEESDEKLNIDTQDAALLPVLKNGVAHNLVLDACNNGEGRKENSHNLASFIARYMPEEVTVFSVESSTNLRNIEIDGDDLYLEWYGARGFEPSGENAYIPFEKLLR